MESQANPALKCLCGREQQGDSGVLVELTPDERAAYQSKGLTAPSHLWYCRACNRILQHPEYGLNLLKGRFIQLLLANGTPILPALRQGDLYHAKLKALQANGVPTKNHFR